MNLDLNCNGFKKFIKVRRNLFDGIQYLFKFENNYGASIVKHMSSYGSEDDLWELAVICWNSDGSDFEITYDTEVTEDVKGYLTEVEVLEDLEQIKNLSMKFIIYLGENKD